MVTAEVGSREGTLLPALVRREQRVDDEVARMFPGMTSVSTRVTNMAGYAAGTVAADGADLSVGAPLDGG